MSELQKGDKVRLVADCFKRPEWAHLHRATRKELARWVCQVLTVEKICWDFKDKVHLRINLAIYCIPAALLETAEPTNLDGKNASFCVIVEMHDYKPNAVPVGSKRTFIGSGGPFVGFDKGDVITKTANPAGNGWSKYVRDSDGLSQGCKDEWTAHTKLAKRVYTPEQIAEARDVSYRIMTSADCCHVYLVQPVRPGLILDTADRANRSKPHTVARELSTEGCERGHYKETDRAVSFCAPNDTWNDDIGIMVALCKLTGTKMPEWVGGGK